MLNDLILNAAQHAMLIVALALKGAFILALCLALTSMLGRRSAAVRHAVLATAFAAVLVLPVLLVVVPTWEVAVMPRAGSAATEVEAISAHTQPLLSDGMAESEHAPQGAAASSLLPATIDQGSGEWSRLLSEVDGRDAVATGLARVRAWLPTGLLDLATLAMLIWMGGLLVVAYRWLGAFWSARAIVDEARPVSDPRWLEARDRARAQMGIASHVRLLISDRLAVPVAWCYARPAVILPADADEWSEERRRVVLMHEHAHIGRRDGLAQVVAQAVLALHWFNPLAWIAYRRMLSEREQACDDLVLSQGVRPSSYAEHLVEIARRFRQQSVAMAAVAAMARNAELSHRVDAILDPALPRTRPGRRGMSMTLAVAALLVFPLAAFSPVGVGSGLAVGGEVGETIAPVVESAETASDWRWQGRARAGDLVEVYVINGTIRVREGDGSTVSVEGTPRGRNAQHARLEVNEVRGGIVICVVHPGQSGCEPGSGPSGRARNTSNASVNLDVVLPARVRLTARTVNGSVRTEPLRAAIDARSTNGTIDAISRTGDVRARTTNGAITIEAAGRADARTTNGSVTARLLATTWSGTSSFQTTNGSVRVEMPRDANVDVDIRTNSGAIRSAFDGVMVERRRGSGATAHGRIGRGGRELDVRTTNGSVTLAVVGDRTSAAVAPARDADPPWPYHAELEDMHHDLVQAQVALQLDMARSALAEIDWAAIQEEVATAHRDAARDMERAREEIERIDWDAITAESRLVAAEAREQLAAIDWDGIRVEMLQAQGEVLRELAEARSEMEGVDWSEMRRTIEESLEQLREVFGTQD